MKNKRNPTTYDKIAKRFKVKSHYVKSILKIGRVNPEYFDLIRRGRMAPYVAYSQALAEERKKKQEVAKEKDPVFFEPSAEPTLETTQVAEPTTTEETDKKVNPAADSSGVEVELEKKQQPVLDSTQVDSKSGFVKRLSADTISFQCPNGCTYVINHDTLSYEEQTED